MRFLYITFLVCGFLPSKIFAQNCTTLGQTPETAFPVCGTTVFQQNTVPICSTVSLYVPGCSSGSTTNYENKNPFYYKFHCYSSGTLSFLVTPNNMGDDYDWQLYDVTGRDPSEVLTNRNIIVTGNWAGTYGATGANSSGVTYIQCASNPRDNKPSFARSPNLIAGHDYILLISHFTDSQSGYSLSFAGGTAVITDPKEPRLQDAFAYCDGTLVRVVLNKKMKCNSLAANGSDFRVSVPGVTATAAGTTQCSRGFDMDTILVSLSAPLPPGTHKIYAKRGTDGNTLKDNCDREVPVGDSVSFTVVPVFPTPMDSITPVKCKPDKLELVFKKRMRCSSIAANGSDFVINGPQSVTISGASGNCDATGLADKIYVQLSAPIVVGGTYTISLVAGNDGNTIIDECGQETPASLINFVTKDTVNATFTYNIDYACDKNTISYAHPGGNQITNWTWTMDSVRIFTQQNPVVEYVDYDSVSHTTLIVTNGVCTDTASVRIVFDNYLKARFTAPDVLCPLEGALFKDTSIGRITNWAWNFGNGNTSSFKNPPLQYYQNRQIDWTAMPQLIVTNDYGCKDTVSKPMLISFSCFIDVPTAFTPNGDGLNDQLYPLVAYKARNLKFAVFNRFGQRLFFTNNWQVKWDGKFRGQEQPPGTYVWQLEYVHADTGQRIFKKGYVVLIR